MVRDTAKYEQAIQLRTRGFTLEEIAKYCDISKSTASKWLKNNAVSADVTKQNKKRAGIENAKRLRLIAKARSGERKKRYADAQKVAKLEFAHFKNNPRFVAGLMAFVMAGDSKHDKTIRFSHIDMQAHRMFVRFSTEFLGVEKSAIHLWLHLYGETDEERAMKQWSKTTGIPLTQFYKNQYINKKSTNVLHLGVGNAIIGSTYHQQKLKTWVMLAKKEW